MGWLPRRSERPALLKGAALALAAGGLAAGAVAGLGLYDVRASSGHWGLVTRAFELARDRAIAAQAESVPRPDHNDPGLAALGAQHYAGACAPCHGRPGGEGNPTMARMLPPPPDLAGAARDYDAEELRFIVLHGLKFAGMPAWPTEARPDEPWALVAFLLALDRDGPGAYDALARGALGEEAEGPAAAAQGDEPAALARCARCHGDAARAPVDDLVPPLGGQGEAYLARALTEYRDEVRPSGIMAAVAHVLSDREIAALARAYAGLRTPAPEVAPATPEALARGEALAARGDPAAEVPACAACHAGASAAWAGRLDGLPQAYLESQLALFAGVEETHGQDRGSTASGAVMAEAARGLTPAMIADVAAFYASLPLLPEAPE